MQYTQRNLFWIRFQRERIVIVVTVFFLIMDQTEFRLVHHHKENYHIDYISFSLKVFQAQPNFFTLLTRQG